MHAKAESRINAMWRAAGRATARFRGNRFHRSLVKGLIDDLQRQLEQTTGVAAASEGQFLEFGKLVSALSQASSRLLEKSRLLIEIALGRDGGEVALSESVELLRTALAAEAWNQEVTSRLIAELSASKGRLLEIRSTEVGLSRSMAVMQVVGVLFRTESARLPENIRGLFLDLASQVSELENQVRDSFGEKFRAVEATRGTLSAAIEGIGQQAHKRSLQADQARRTLDESLRAMASQINDNQTREVDLMGLSRQLTGEADRIVMGLQTHDIISQRLLHVQQALNRIRSETTDPGDSAGAGLLRKFYEFCQLEAGQLSGAKEDLRRAIESIRTATAAIMAQVEAVDEESGLFSHFSDATSTSAAMVQVLLDASCELHDMLAAAASAGSRSRATVSPILQVVSGLNAAMTEVSFKLGLVALNAQVLAVQKGDGTGLEVLAARAAQTSKETESFGASISWATEEVARRIAEVVEGFENAETRMRIEAEALECGGGRHEQKLHGIRDQMLSCLQDLGSTVDEIRDVVQRLSGLADVLARPLDQLEGARVALEEAGKAAARVAGNDLGARSSRDWEKWLQKSYTMSSERKVHEAVLEGVAPVSADDPADGDVELF